MFAPLVERGHFLSEFPGNLNKEDALTTDIMHLPPKYWSPVQHLEVGLLGSDWSDREDSDFIHGPATGDGGGMTALSPCALPL